VLRGWKGGTFSYESKTSECEERQLVYIIVIKSVYGFCTFIHEVKRKEIREENLWQTVAREKLWNYVSANKFGSSGLLPLFVLLALKKN
jgi:hypothetical protein